MKNKEIIVQMIQIFKTVDNDWMNYKIDNNNTLTYHHIVARRNGGKELITNGALLTVKAHRKLHFLEANDEELFLLWQELFLNINHSYEPPNEEYVNQMVLLKKRTDEIGKR